jgi:cell shape-determining protein MreD
LIGYLSGNTISQMVLNNPVNQFIMVLGVSLTEGVLLWLILVFSQPNPPDTQQMLLLTVLPQALYNALLAPLVMLVAERLDSSRKVRYSSGRYSTGKYLGSYRG